MAMDPEFQFAYWSTLVQSQQLETIASQMDPWINNFSIDNYPGETDE